ncbi:MAG: response regulator transcription factor, partial [Xanthomonadales bacterium]|nr:response regulator transcription factor [Xanthomonadales bacterium]
ARVLVITSFGDRQTVVRAIAAGADGYLLKDSSSEAITEGIRVTLDGGAPISAAAAVYLLERLREAPPPTPAPLNPDEAALTAREIELLHCFAIGQSYKEAARTLGISPHTVGNHVKSIYRKLEVHSRAEAIYEAVQGGQLRL